MSARFDVNALKIASPCPARWEDMAGDDRARFCKQCQKHVYNFSSMTTKEVEVLIEGTGGKVCGRMYRRADGMVLTTDCPTGEAVVKRKRLQWAASVFASIALLGTALWKLGKEPEGTQGPVFTAIQQQWYSLKVKLGWAQPPIMLGEIMAPIGPSPIMNNNPSGSFPVIPPSPPPVNGSAVP
ncbi:MAG TPA: hypothetical protein VGH19_22785 [Verrucomicrobiae bacterium]